MTDALSSLVDLTLETFHGMPISANTNLYLPRPIILPLVTHEQAKAEGLGSADDPLTFAGDLVTFVDHTGTHVDAPYHVDPDGTTIDEMSLDWFTGKAVCLDLRHLPDRSDITEHELEDAEKAAGVTVDGHIVLVCTGHHAKHWPRGEILTLNSGLTAAATHWLADRGSRAHGVEGPSADKGGTSDFPNHRVCRDRGIVHYEWLVNLEQLVGRGEFRFYGFPLKLRRGTGSPVRAVADLTKS